MNQRANARHYYRQTIANLASGNFSIPSLGPFGWKLLTWRGRGGGDIGTAGGGTMNKLVDYDYWAVSPTLFGPKPPPLLLYYTRGSQRHQRSWQTCQWATVWLLLSRSRMQRSTVLKTSSWVGPNSLFTWLKGRVRCDLKCHIRTGFRRAGPFAGRTGILKMPPPPPPETLPPPQAHAGFNYRRMPRVYFYTFIRDRRMTDVNRP